MDSAFDKSLSNFTSDIAYVQAVRHLYDVGLSVSEIQKECLYPVSEEKIRKVIADYEEEKASPDGKKRFVVETDKYGKHSFRQVE